jgi:hypothetical protein
MLDLAQFASSLNQAIPSRAGETRNDPSYRCFGKTPRKASYAIATLMFVKRNF